MKIVLKWFTTILLCMFLMGSTSYASVQNFAPAVSNTTQTHQQVPQISNASNKDFVHTNNNILYYRSSYHSGFRAPSSRVSKSRYSGSRSTYGSTGTRSVFGGGFGSHLFSFGAGWFLGGLFHPFGGYYGVGYHSFSIYHILFDIFIIWVIWRVIRRIFR